MKISVYIQSINGEPFEIANITLSDKERKGMAFQLLSGGDIKLLIPATTTLHELDIELEGDTDE